MNDTFRAMCAELIDSLENARRIIQGADGTLHINTAEFVLRRARALLDQPVAEGLTDEEIEEWADACSEAPLEEMDPEVHGWRRCFTAKEFSETIRAALDRFGRPTPQQEPERPTDEDLEHLADVMNVSGNPVPAMRRALELWGRPTPQPVAVSERLPEPDDCDEQGRCWVFDDQLGLPSWTLIRVQGGSLAPDMYWLPANALPTRGHQ